MNVSLWVIQALLALHTATGALWKFSKSERSVPSLKSIPHGVWLGMSVVELVCSLGLVLPAFQASLSILAPIAAACIAAEMLIFSAMHFRSGSTNHGEMIYWLVVAAVCGIVVYGRLVLIPL